jgi:tetratricopeptide (TPR) repeat protein
MNTRFSLCSACLLVAGWLIVTSQALFSSPAASGIDKDTVRIKNEIRELSKKEIPPKEKEVLARQLIDISRRAGYTEGVLHASFVLATSYFFQQEYQRSYTVLDSMLIQLGSQEQNLPTGKTLEDKKARIYTFMGTIYDEIGDFNKAIEFYLKALVIIEPYGDKWEKSVLYKNLGMLNMTVGNVSRARQYFDTALVISKDVGDTKTIFDIYNTLQGHYTDSAKYDVALRYGLKLLDIAKENKDPYSLALANYALGSTYLASGNHVLAEGFLNEALQVSLRNRFETVTIQAYVGLTTASLSQSKLNEAGIFAAKAMNAAETLGLMNLRAMSAENYAKVLDRIHDYRGALKYYRLFEEFNDSVNQKKSARIVLEMQSRYEMDKIHRERKLLEDQLMIKQYQVNQRNYLLYATLAGIFFLAVFLFIQIRRYRHVQRLNRQLHEQQNIINDQADILQKEKDQLFKLEIEHKNRELTSIAMALAQENEFKRNLILDLEQIRSGISPVRKAEIKALANTISAIKLHISNNSWEEFKTYFENVYSTFYTNLEKEFIDLNPNEKKLCAMLRLGLSTKEISNLTYREIKSVESARNRLRKKMKLDPKTHLTTFLAKF